MQHTILFRLIFFILIITFIKINSQTGVLTQNPSHPLHIDGANDNSNTPTILQLLNDVVVTNDGKLGIGVINPRTKVDVRSSDQKGIIGLGTNIQTASVAGIGAIRYSSGNIIQYSDGVGWHDLPMTLPPKVLVLANKNSTQSLINNNTIQVVDWKEVMDDQSNFDHISGIFTAPRPGFYIVSFNVTLAVANIAQNSRIETIIESNELTDNITTYRSVNSYPAWNISTVNNIVGGNCTAIFNLSAGSTIQFKVFHNFGGNRYTSTENNGTNNSISIYEL
ncbi:hypothetical protein [Chryseobacterium sp. G0201]|uniref:hypothetical protein n=1 Tax=Chryseobacterium sp. G0201 TaxID=2487065 RepID=UPI000F4E6E20|nr:hypothetical protein [Chryseobacterium sp. G0201]AZA53966.1 hypothetical protein EG348_13620 [Chryseobacterium sp. G0201]